MARYSDEDIIRIREATNALDLVREYAPDLKPKGRDYWACCPFHSEKSPSFKVDPHTGRWHCFGACSEGGDVFSFVQKTQNLSFPEAVEFLAQRAGIEIAVDPQAKAAAARRKRLLAVCADTADFYATYLRRSPTEDAKVARNYLTRRSMGSEVAAAWKLGFAPGGGALIAHLRSKGHRDEDMIAANVASPSRYGNKDLRDFFFNRLIFPISDVQGQVIAFGGRVLDNSEPKYINSSATSLFDKSRNLYGIDHARAGIHAHKMVLVVEGYTDVIALHQAGYNNSVAILGTSLTSQHVKILSRTASRIIYILDGDNSGKQAAARAVQYVDSALSPEYSATPVNLDVISLPEGADPADMMAHAEGKRQFEALLERTQPLVEFAIDLKLDDWDLARPEARMQALHAALPILAPLKGTLIVGSYANYLADRLTRAGGNFTEEVVLEALEKIKAPATPRAQGSSQTSAAHQQAPAYEGPIDFEAADEGAGVDVLPQLSQTELDERELLALMIVQPSARELIFETQTDCPFTHPMYRAIYEQMEESIAKGQPIEVAALDESIPGVAQLIAAYNFEDSDVAARELAGNLLYRLRESALERKIRIIRSDLQRDESNKTLVEALTQASRELHGIRARRFE
ncbi:MAG: DNA primase [Coriobacteriia bacterium]|nr:DNA primase [Coriobacteriia bacterium]MCL2537801.1 DNA primase [Coriobacteriia bacterium]